MQKTKIVQDYCNDILCCSWINEEMSDNLLVAAGLVEDDITHTGCDVLGKTASELARYIRENISFCSKKIQEDTYFLLVELSCNTVH